MESTKKLIRDMQNKGVVCSYESHVEVESAGIVVGIILIAIPMSFLVFANFFTPLYLIPLLGGLYLTIVGIITFLRKLKRR